MGSPENAISNKGIKMDQAFVTIVLTLYNGEKYIRQTIENIISQTYTHWELIVVNDASTDKSSEIVHSFDDPRIRIIDLPENGHVSMAHQVGDREAKGKYIAVQDKDDLWDPSKLEKQVSWMEAHPETGACFTLVQMIDENDIPVDDPLISELYQAENRNRQSWLYDLLTTGNHLANPSVLIRKSVLDDVGLFNLAFLQLHDYELWLRIVQKYDLHVIQEKLYFYRRFSGSGSISQVNEVSDHRTFFEYAWTVGHTILNMEPELFKAVFRDEIRFPESEAETEILIEKALILASDLPVANCKGYAFDIFEELFQDPDTVSILKEKYGISQHDIYRMTGNSIIFNRPEADAVNERDDLREQLKNAKFALSEMEASTSWRVTEPIRALTGGVRELKVFHLFTKGLKELKHYRPGYVLKKVRRKFLTPLDLEDDQVRYQLWISQNETGCEETKPSEYQPLISIILVKAGSSDTDSLETAIQSVLRQIYPNWELYVIADTFSEKSQIEFPETLKNDSRIHVRSISKKQDLAADINSVLPVLQGDYTLFLSGHDILSENALYEAVKLLATHPEYDIIYSDEDRITADGKQRHTPFFKPDWSPDTFLSFMYIGCMSVYKTSVLRKTGSLHEGSAAAAIYDLTLRFMDHSSKDRVGHIQKILCHRADKDDAEKKSGIRDELRKIKEETLVRRGLSGKTEAVPDTDQVRIVYDCPPDTKVSIIIPSKDNVSLLKQCIESIKNQPVDVSYEIIVVDNGSSEENRATLMTMRDELGFRYIYKLMSFNFSRMCNIGADAASGNLLLFLNDDTKAIHAHWLDRMAGQACQKHAGAVGAKLLYPDSDLIQHCGVTNLCIGPAHSFMGTHDSEIQYFGWNRLDHNLIAVTGACLLVDRQKFKRAGKFDETFPIAYNDMDLCFNLYEAGYYNSIRNDVQLVHYESMSRGLDVQNKEKMERLRIERNRLYNKHPGLDGKDPFYSPHLIQDRDNFKVRVLWDEL